MFTMVLDLTNFLTDFNFNRVYTLFIDFMVESKVSHKYDTVQC